VILGVDGKAHGAELHFDDWVMSVARLWGSGELGYVPRLDIGQYPFKRDGRNVVTLIHDHVPVGCNDILPRIAANEALQHGHIQMAVRLALAPADSPNGLTINAEEHGQLVHPLIEQRLTMDKDERASSTLRHQMGADYRLASAGRRHKNAYIVCQQRPRRPMLRRCELAIEGYVKRLPEKSLVIDEQLNPVSTKKLVEGQEAAVRKGDMLRKLLGAGDHTWRERCGQAHALLLLKLGILERR